ncbi:MAG: hypothetical protein HY898_23360 [Deltaproteobacteria bacterium]|nr:hypothetical protein [Deltaproteobacteria bacterium]
MSEPTLVCLERLSARPEERFVRCVALGGAGPGLALDARGAIVWMQSTGIACALRMSRDGQLLAVRSRDALSVHVHRAGRSLEAPCDKPVVLLAGDEIEIAQARWRIHLHGPAAEIHPPRLLSPRRWVAMAAMATAVVAGCKTDATGGVDGQAPDAALADAALSDAALLDALSEQSDAWAEGGGGEAEVDAQGDGAADAAEDAPEAKKSPVRPAPGKGAPGRVPKQKIEVRDFPPFAE